MKRILSIALIVLVSSFWNGSFAQINGGFKMGIDFSNLKWDIGSTSMNDQFDTKRLITPRLGFFMDVNIVEGLFANIGVYGSSKGFRYKDTRTIDGVDYDSKEYQILATIDIPLNVGYRYDFGGITAFGMLGPNLSYGLYATALYKANGEYDNDHQTVGKEISDTFKPMNFGINVEAGVELDRFQFSAYFTQGLSELSNIDAQSIKSSVFGLNVAIKFGNVE